MAKEKRETRRQKILRAMTDRGFTLPDEIAKELGLGFDNVRKEMVRMAEAGLLQRQRDLSPARRARYTYLYDPGGGAPSSRIQVAMANWFPPLPVGQVRTVKGLVGGNS